MQEQIKLTDKALEKIQAILADNKDSFLKIFVVGGGCAGFEYCFKLTCEVSDYDIKHEARGVKLLVDGLSMGYLQGATIDYVKNLQGERFIVTNPNASTTCSCGASFSA